MSGESSLLLTYEDVANELKVSTRTVARLVGDGKIPSVTVGARSRRIRRAALEEYISSIEAAKS